MNWIAKYWWIFAVIALVIILVIIFRKEIFGKGFIKPLQLKAPPPEITTTTTGIGGEKKTEDYFPLKKGSKNTYVLNFQKKYNYFLPKFSPPILETGIFDDETEVASLIALGSKEITQSQYDDYVS